MIKDLLTAALQYREMGQPCIAVRATKKPYRTGWNRFFNEAQTENKVRLEFSNGTYGLAAVLYPASNYIHLDFDGPCSGAAFESTGIDLPETAQISTPSGGFHLIFTAAPLLRKFKISRKVRLVKAGCSCKKNGKPHRCGVDLLLNGYSVVPPTKGYGEDPEHPLEDAVEIPDALIELALRKHKTKSQNTLTNGARIVDGERNSKLSSLAGTMRRRDLSYEAILAALKVENQNKWDPPSA